jgi:hypothetical protein
MRVLGLSEKIGNETRKLYCVAWEQWDGKDWRPQLEYMHAIDAQNALLVFKSGHWNRVHRVIGIAPVVGYHVHDTHGESLSV